MTDPFAPQYALCLYGMTGNMGARGRGAPVDFEYCADSIRRCIIHPNNCDVFLHSWSVENQKKLVEIYKPVDACFQTMPKLPGPNHDSRAAMGRWISTAEVLALLAGRHYKTVMLCRYDVVFKTMVFFGTLPKDKLCVSNFNLCSWQTPANTPLFKEGTIPHPENISLYKPSLQDLWFVGPQEVIKLFGKIWQLAGVRIPWGVIESPHKTANSLVKMHKIPIHFVLRREDDYELYRILFPERQG